MAKEEMVSDSARLPVIDDADAAKTALTTEPSPSAEDSRGAEQARRAEHTRLAEQARAGNMAAFARLVSEYQDRVLNTCWRIAGHWEDAQDLTQEAFLQALEKMETFQQKASFYTWLFRIAVNLSISHRRRSAREVKLSLHGPDGQWSEDHQAVQLVGRASDDQNDPPSRLSAREIEQCVVNAMEKLEDDQRAVLVLRDIESFDYRQIADILEISVGTVKSRLHRARMALRERLKAMVSRPI